MKYRKRLPQRDGRLFLSDCGVEGSLLFRDGIRLPELAAFSLLNSPKGEIALRQHYGSYLSLSRGLGIGLVVESATWRCHADVGLRLGYSTDALAQANRRAIAVLEELRQEFEADRTPIVIAGCVGPRHEPAFAHGSLTLSEAIEYHQPQIDTLARTTCDFINGTALTGAGEATGIAEAARRAGMPCALSFAIGADGRLPNRQTLAATIDAVDRASAGYPAYYSVDCAHPLHLHKALADGGSRWARLRGLRHNPYLAADGEARHLQHSSPGMPQDVGPQYAQLKRALPSLNILGWCRGTGYRHIEQLATVFSPLFAQAR